PGVGPGVSELHGRSEGSALEDVGRRVRSGDLRDDILDEHLNHVGVAESTRFRHFEYERIGALIRDDEREGGISPGAGAWANNGVAALHRPVVSRADSEA